MSDDPEFERHLYRIGGSAAAVGAVLGMVGNLIHPVTPIDDPAGVARVIADSDIWVPVHLVIVLGIVLMLGGLVAIYQAQPGSPIPVEDRQARLTVAAAAPPTSD